MSIYWESVFTVSLRKIQRLSNSVLEQLKCKIRKIFPESGEMLGNAQSDEFLKKKREKESPLSL